MTSDTLSSAPEHLARVANRKAFIGYVLDKAGVPMDGVSSPALIDMALFVANLHGRDPKWIVKMLRDYANAIELHYAPIDGPKQ